MKILLSILLLLFSLNALSQQTVTITGKNYNYNGKSLSILVLSPIKTPNGEFIHLAEIPASVNNTFNYKLQLDKPTLLIIRYLNAYRVAMVYAKPGDSIHINFEELQKAEYC